MRRCVFFKFHPVSYNISKDKHFENNLYCNGMMFGCFKTIQFMEKISWEYFPAIYILDFCFLTCTRELLILMILFFIVYHRAHSTTTNTSKLCSFFEMCQQRDKLNTKGIVWGKIKCSVDIFCPGFMYIYTWSLSYCQLIQIPGKKPQQFSKLRERTLKW